MKRHQKSFTAMVLTLLIICFSVLTVLTVGATKANAEEGYIPVYVYESWDRFQKTEAMNQAIRNYPGAKTFCTRNSPPSHCWGTSAEGAKLDFRLVKIEEVELQQPAIVNPILNIYSAESGLMVDLYPGSYAGQSVKFFLAVQAETGLQCLNSNFQWQTCSMERPKEIPAFIRISLAELKAFPLDFLPKINAAGEKTLFIGFDLNPNGILDWSEDFYLSSVKIPAEPPGRREVCQMNDDDNGAICWKKTD